MSLFKAVYRLIIFLLILTSSFTRAAESYDILMLHSYEKGNVWTEELDNSFRYNLHRKNKYRINFYTEYMDSKRFFGREYDEVLAKLYATKFSSHKIDLIVTTDDYAFDFAIKYRNEIFNDAPIIFSGVNGYDKFKRDLYRTEKNFTGVVETFDVIPTVKSALLINPKATKIYVINTQFTPTGRYLKKQFESSFEKMNLKQKIIYIENYNMEEIYEMAKHFEDDSIVLFGVYARDRDGKYFELDENIKNLSKFSAQPIYGFNKVFLNKGIVGGNVSDGTIYGREIARMANEYLSGEKKISEIPLIVDSINDLVFDYDQLKRYNIDVEKLPKRSKIISYSSSFFQFYHEYKSELLVVFACFVCLCIFFFILLYFFEKQRSYKDLLIRVNEKLERNVHDRTVQLVQQQSQIINSARLASIGEMASGIAHEINNPLTIIDLSANRISQRTDLDSIKKNAGRISSTAFRISKIIKGLKHLAKDGDKSKSADFHLIEAVEDVTSLCYEKFKENDIEFKINVDESIVIHGSIVQIAQVLLNLINNSFDELIKVNGERRINLKAIPIRKYDNDYVEVSITDTGRGIPDDIKAKIMEPFFTTKKKNRGTGLGLSISKSNIEKHGGEFYLDESSTLTRFVFVIPLKKS
ncbi:ABC transporter substrate binding protein [Halobacteriovorax sp. RT-1-4]|uniref:sensor histidine kinase n=1 Tax=unclassified Halobacteriovorax TaxID=2639665 RepID=UPI00399A65AB